MNMNLSQATNNVPDGTSHHTYAVHLSVRGRGFYLADAANSDEAIAEAREELNCMIRQLRGQIDLAFDDFVVEVGPAEEISTGKSN
jgi:hypothetical protein